MGARPLLPPIHRRTQYGLSSPVGSLLGFAKTMRGRRPPVAAADAAGSGFALEGSLLGGEEEARGERASSRLQRLDLKAQRISVDFQRTHQTVSVQPAGQLEHA